VFFRQPVADVQVRVLGQEAEIGERIGVGTPNFASTNLAFGKIQ
jgi:hypothetical protein